MYRLKKVFYLTITILFTFLVETSVSLSICSSATWTRNATTVAGSSTGLWGLSSTELNIASAVLFDKNQNLYVLDYNNFRIQLFPFNSIVGQTIIDYNFVYDENQELFSLTAMRKDENDMIYIVDRIKGRVIAWNPISKNGSLVVDATDQVNNPNDIFIESNGSIIWIADTYNHRILKWTSMTTSNVAYGSYGSDDDQFMNPYGLFIDIKNSKTILYVADTYNHRIQMWIINDTTRARTVAGITNFYGNSLNQLWIPTTLQVDENQYMYIVDTGNNRIVRWMIGSNQGIIIAGDIDSGTLSNQLYMPWDLTFDSNGSLFVADALNNRIQKFTISCLSTGNLSNTSNPSTTPTSSILDKNCSMITYAFNATTIAGSPIGFYGDGSFFLTSPSDVFIDKNNTIYVIDKRNYRVQRFLSNSSIGTTIIYAKNNSLLDEFSQINGIHVDTNENIYLLDGGSNNRVIKWTPKNNSGTIVAGGNGNGNNTNQINQPSAMFIESDTLFIWISDTSNHRIVRWESPYTGIIVCGDYGSQSNQFNNPNGLFIDLSDSKTLYVADTYNHRIQKWLANYTNGLTVAGQTGVFGSAYNQLTYPIALIVDSNKSIFIVDKGNNRIMRWIEGSTSGMIIAGDSSAYGVFPSQLNQPNSIKFDQQGALIIVDTYNHRIQKFSISCQPPSTETNATSNNMGISPNITVTQLLGFILISILNYY